MFRTFYNRRAIFALLFSMMLGLSSCGPGEDATVPTLYIISPNGTDIRLEFAARFSEWHQKKYGTAVNIRWPDIGGGGTQNIIKQLTGDYAQKPTSGYDLVWGGGSATFESFRQKNFLVKPPLDDTVLAQVPKDIFGAPLHGAGDAWIAAAMSNFGISYNKDRVAELGLTVPRLWQDLAGPKWFGLLSMSDPSKSGAVRSSYDQIFVQYGWEKGWGLMTLMFANADNLRESGSAPADDVGSAQAVAGITIDFYGRKEIQRMGGKLVGFVIPEGGTITDCDPIAMLKGAPHPDLAAHFIEFVISEEGQKLWVFRANTPGGPTHYVLGRLSVLPAMYEKYPQYLEDPVNPFAVAEPLKATPKESTIRSGFVGDVIKSALIDNHDLLVAARRAILQAGDPPDLLAKLEAVPHFSPTGANGDASPEDTSRAISASEQPAVAAEFWPPSGSASDSPEVTRSKNLKQAKTGELQTRLKDGWQKEYRTRLQELVTEAESRRK